MANVEFAPNKIDPDQEVSRVAALASTGILDTEPEASYDAITRLCADYFQADTVLLKFADESRVWIKSCAGQALREIPRKNSIFNMVLAEDGPVIISDMSKHPGLRDSLLELRRLDTAFLASVPVRSFENKILGVLTIYCRHPRQGMEPASCACWRAWPTWWAANWSCGACALCLVSRARGALGLRASRWIRREAGQA
jgi:GAF domain-containing protein